MHGWGEKWDYHAGNDPVLRSEKGKGKVIFLVERGSHTAINVMDSDMTTFDASHTSLFLIFSKGQLSLFKYLICDYPHKEALDGIWGKFVPQ